MALFRSLKHRPFALLWSGQTISRVGDFLYEIALAWWVLEKTGSATAMAMVLVFSLSPMLLFLLVGGVAVDRFPRVPLMLASDLARGIIVSIVAVLAFGQSLEVWHVYIASLLFGFVDAFFQPAVMAITPQLVITDDLPSANALVSIGVQAGRIVGPPLGAALIALGGTPTAFAIDAASFFVSAVCLVPLLRLPLPRPEVSEEGSSVLRDLREGMRTVAASPWLWLTMAVVAVTNVTLSGPYQIAFPFLVKEHFGGEVRTLGLLYAMFPIGYILGGVWVGRFPRLRHRGWVSYGTLMIAALGMVTIGLPVGIAIVLLAAVINGAALEISNVAWTTSLQERVPNEQLGRVSSIDMLGSYGLLPVGFAIAGWTTNAWGASTVCIVGGAIAFAAAGLGLLHPAVRSWD